jgi:hypothetical protein
MIKKQQQQKGDFQMFENISFFDALTTRGPTLMCSKWPNLNYRTIWGLFFTLQVPVSRAQMIAPPQT